MQPCAVCGSTTINATGHCAHCGTYRGVPGQVPGAPPAPQPYPGQPGYPPQPVGGASPGYPQPVSASPGYPQPVSGGTPGYPQPGMGGPGYPTSSPPAPYPTSGGGYPGGFPPPAPAQRRSFLIPLVALASTLVVLVVAIILVISSRDDEGTGPLADPTTSAPAVEQTQANPDIDPCVVGTWRITSHREEVNNEELGKLVFTGGEGGELELKEDGSGETDYGDGTKYTADAGDQQIRLEILGLVSFHYTAVDGRISMTDVESHATFKFFIDDEQYGDTEAFDASETPSSYTCSDGSLTQKTLLFTTEYEQID